MEIAKVWIDELRADMPRSKVVRKEDGTNYQHYTKDFEVDYETIEALEISDELNTIHQESLHYLETTDIKMLADNYAELTADEKTSYITARAKARQTVRYFEDFETPEGVN